MQALVITLREGMEAALVVGVILIYLGRIGRSDLTRYVYAGLILAAAASVLGALAFSLAGFDPENEVLEGSMLAVAAVLVAGLIIWMGLASRNVKRRIEDRIRGIAAEEGHRQGWGLFAFAFFMVFREGVEIVIFLAALSLAAADGLLNLIGGTAGLGLALLFGALFVKGSVRIDLRRFFAVTALVLVALVIRLLAGSIHEFSEVGILPSWPWELAVIGFIVKDSTSIFLLIVLILLPGLAILPSLRMSPEEKAALPGENAAQRRKRIAALVRARRWGIGVVATALLIAAPLAATAYMAEASGYRPEPVQLQPREGSVRVSLAGLKNDALYKFSYQGSEGETRFIVVNRSDGGPGVALDVCSICPPRGYHQEGENVICDNCNAPIEIATIGIPGGCNPKPLAYTVEGSEIAVSVDSLESFGVDSAR